MSESPYAHLAGHRFPGGTAVFEPYEAWLWADAVGGVPDPGALHPSAAHPLAMRGIGLEIDDVFRLLETDAESGVLMGETEFVLDGVLVPGERYVCDAAIDSVERKHGARAGTFDLLRFTVHVRRAAGEDPLAVVTYTWVIPRREG